MCECRLQIHQAMAWVKRKQQQWNWSKHMHRKNRVCYVWKDSLHPPTYMYVRQIALRAHLNVIRRVKWGCEYKYTGLCAFAIHNNHAQRYK